MRRGGGGNKVSQESQTAAWAERHSSRRATRRRPTRRTTCAGSALVEHGEPQRSHRAGDPSSASGGGARPFLFRAGWPARVSVRVRRMDEIFSGVLCISKYSTSLSLGKFRSPWSDLGSNQALQGLAACSVAVWLHPDCGSILHGPLLLQVDITYLPSLCTHAHAYTC